MGGFLPSFPDGGGGLLNTDSRGNIGLLAIVETPRQSWIAYLWTPFTQQINQPQSCLSHHLGDLCSLQSDLILTSIRFGFNSTHTWQTPVRHQAHCLLLGTARRIMNLQTTGDQEKVRHTIGDHREAFSPSWSELHYSQFSISWKSLD